MQKASESGESLHKPSKRGGSSMLSNDPKNVVADGVEKSEGLSKGK
jgi:hypothetical protein